MYKFYSVKQGTSKERNGFEMKTILLFFHFNTEWDNVTGHSSWYKREMCQMSVTEYRFNPIRIRCSHY